MSHFSTMRTKLTNKNSLINAIQAQSEVQQARENYAVRGYNGQAVKGDVVAVLKGEYDIGFNFKEDCYVAIADFAYGDCGGGDSSLLELWRKIVASYAANEAQRQAQQTKGLSQATVNVTV